MKSFEQLYLETADLFESGHFKSPKWINTVTTNLLKLRMMWPNHDYLELSEIVKDNIWRVEQIYLWSFFTDENLENNLRGHGSLNFYYLSQILPEQTREDLLRYFHVTSQKVTDNNHVLTEMTLKKIEELNSSSSDNKVTQDEHVVNKCNALSKDIWQLLIDDCKVWEFDLKFIELLEKISKQRFKITKKDSPFFISQIEELISRKYLKKTKYQQLFQIFNYV